MNAKRSKSSKNKTKFGDPRSIRDYRRRAGSRPPGKILVIICEGKITEPYYFLSVRQSLRLPTFRVKVVPGKVAPITVVTRGVEEKNNLDDPRDEVWCVFDTEVVCNNPTIDAAIRLAKRENLFLAISNPAFEYWFLLHFECTNRPFSGVNDLIKSLKNHIPEYERNRDIFPLLQERILDAINNVENLCKISDPPWDEYPNPSTGVKELITRILELSEQQKR